MYDVRLPQALAEALTTSAKGMVGRRLLQCSDLTADIDLDALNPGNWFGRRLFSLPSDQTMSTRRQLYKVGFESECNTIVNGFKATWDKVKKAAVGAANQAANVAAATARTLLNEARAATRAVEKLANDAAAAATRTLNAVKAEAEKAANAATKFMDDIGNAFSELGKEIQCAAPLPPPALMSLRNRMC